MNSAAVLGLKNYIPAAATKQDRGERNELMLCGGSADCYIRGALDDERECS